MVGASTYLGFGLASMAGFGYIEDYRFSGGLPYDSDTEKPSVFKNHFFTPDGTIQVQSASGSTTCYVHSYEDLSDADPYLPLASTQLRSMNLLVKSQDALIGYLPKLSWIGSSRIAFQNEDLINTVDRIFLDGERENYLVLLHQAVSILDPIEPVAVSAIGSIANPVVVYGSLVLDPDPVSAVGSLVDPWVILPSMTIPALPVSAIGSVFGATVILGSTAAGTYLSAIGSIANPEVILGSIVCSTYSVSAVGDIVIPNVVIA